MAEVQGEVRVRNVGPRRSDSFTESAVEFGGGLVRLGVSLLTLPMAVLPPESRQHMRNATRELAHAFATLPRDFADVANEAIEQWASEADGPAPKKAPKDELTAG